MENKLMSLIIDKRFLPKNNTANSRQKFVDRYKKAIKQRIREIVDKNSIDGFNKGNKKIKIKSDDLDIPNFDFEPGTGNTDRVYIGNKKYKRGDKGKRPPKGNGKGGKAGSGSGGEDDFEFVLTEKEFSDLFFEDLALPDMVKKQFLSSIFEIKHAGFSNYGGPSSLNIKKTMLNALGRRIALKRKSLRETNPYLKDLTDEELRTLCKKQARANCAVEGIEAPRKQKIQYIEDMDLKYNFKDRLEVPATKAVMVCIMDVSGSMGETEKDLAKRFYILLNMFLKRNYEVVDVVFIRHAETASEVDEETFFNARDSGGTIISSAYDVADKILKQRYNTSQWNIYIAQASDGDNWSDDTPEMERILTQHLLPITQYFAYVNISARLSGFLRGMTEYMSEVSMIMKRLMKSHKNLQARDVTDYKDIFPVFRSLFKKKEGK